MEGNYDPEYAQKMFKKIKNMGGTGIFFDKLHIAGEKNLEKTDNTRRLYLSNHVSHADYMTLWYQFHKQGAQMPMIAAGKNLDLHLLKTHFVDFGRVGAFWVDRDGIKSSDKETVSRLSKKIKELSKEGHDFLVFPEGGRSYDGTLFENYQTGIIKRIIEQKEDIEIVPIAVDYSERIEEPYFKMLKESKKLSNNIGKALYLATDIVAFTSAYMLRDKKAFINVGKPKRLSDIVNNPNDTRETLSAIKDFSIEKITNLYQEIQNIK